MARFFESKAAAGVQFLSAAAKLARHAAAIRQNRACLRLGIAQAGKAVRKDKAMIKTFPFINEMIKDSRHPFRKTDQQPRKAQKNRYERRKVKELLHLGDWTQEETA